MASRNTFVLIVVLGVVTFIVLSLSFNGGGGGNDRESTPPPIVLQHEQQKQHQRQEQQQEVETPAPPPPVATPVPETPAPTPALTPAPPVTAKQTEAETTVTQKEERHDESTTPTTAVAAESHFPASDCECPPENKGISLMPKSCMASPEQFPLVDDLFHSDQRYCELIALESRHCRRCETFAQCHSRLNLRPILTTRCWNSTFYRSLPTPAPESSARHLSFGQSWASQINGYTRERCGLLRRDDNGNDNNENSSNTSTSRIALERQRTSEMQRRAIARARPMFKMSDERIGAETYVHSYSIPTDWIIERPLPATEKLFGFMPLDHRLLKWPGGRHQALSGPDDVVVRSYIERSYFSLANCRHGFSSSRLLEHIGSGTIPILIDLDICKAANPPSRGGCLPGLPLDLLQEAWELPCLAKMFGNLSKYRERCPWKTSTNISIIANGEVDWTRFDLKQYEDLASRFVQFAHDHLSSKAVAAQFLKALNPPPRYRNPIRHALVVCDTNEMVDSHTIVNGLIDLGVHVTLAKVKHNFGWRYLSFYSRFPSMSNASWIERFKLERQVARGKGHIYSWHADPSMLSECVNEECAQLIAADAFDVAFYTLVIHERQREFWTKSIANTGYPLLQELKDSGMGKHRIFIVDGDDAGRAVLHWMGGFATLSRREVRDDFEYWNYNSLERWRVFPPTPAPAAASSTTKKR